MDKNIEKAVAQSVGRSVAKLVFGTIAGLVTSALVEHTIDAVATRRQNKTTETDGK